MQRRLPKRGFNNPLPQDDRRRSTSATRERFDAGATVDERALAERGLVQRPVDRVKVLGDGELTKKLTVTAHASRHRRKEKIEKAGGKVELVGRDSPAKKPCGRA